MLLKNHYQIGKSFKYCERFRRYEILPFSSFGRGFYYFKNKNDILEFSRVYTDFVDEILYHIDLILTKLQGFVSFFEPFQSSSTAKEKVYLKNLNSSQILRNQMKLYKVRSCELYEINHSLLSLLSALDNCCISIDKRFVKELNSTFQHILSIRERFYYLMLEYQKIVKNSDFLLIPNPIS